MTITKKTVELKKDDVIYCIFPSPQQFTLSYIKGYKQDGYVKLLVDELEECQQGGIRARCLCEHNPEFDFIIEKNDKYFTSFNAVQTELNKLANESCTCNQQKDNESFKVYEEICDSLTDIIKEAFNDENVTKLTNILKELGKTYERGNTKRPGA